MPQNCFVNAVSWSPTTRLPRPVVWDGNAGLTWWHTDIDLEAVLNKEHASTPARVVAIVHRNAPVKFENRPTESRRTKDEDVVSEIAKSAMKGLVATELSPLLKE